MLNYGRQATFGRTNPCMVPLRKSPSDVSMHEQGCKQHSVGWLVLCNLTPTRVI